MIAGERCLNLSPGGLAGLIIIIDARPLDKVAVTGQIQSLLSKLGRLSQGPGPVQQVLHQVSGVTGPHGALGIIARHHFLYQVLIKTQAKLFTDPSKDL